MSTLAEVLPSADGSSGGRYAPLVAAGSEEARAGEADAAAARDEAAALAEEDNPPGKPWFVNPHVCWRHPVARIAVVFTIMALDFYIYGEDPVNDSHVEYNFPGLGHIYGLLFLWPREARLVLLRALCIVVFSLLGLYVSRQWIHHRILRDCMGLSMFEGHKGSLLIMFFGIAGAFYGAALAYNALIPEGAKPIEPRTYAEIRNVGKAFQIWSVFLDIMSIVQILDAVFQDRTVYPEWAAGFKQVWNTAWGGWFRVLAVWFAVLVAVAAETLAVLDTGPKGPIQWRDNSIGGTSEITRTLFVNWIIFCDLLTVCQDWEFPTFNEGLDIKIAGTFQTQISCGCLSGCMRSLCKCLPSDFVEFFHFAITGPWLTYGPLLLVMMADLGCARTQFMYNPKTYGQYADPVTGHIWTIIDPDYLQLAYRQGVLVRPELVTWAARHDNATGELLPDALTDIESNSRFLGTHWVWLALLPGVFAILAFVCLVYGGERAWRSHAMELLGKAGEEVGREVELAANTLKSVSEKAMLTPSSRSPPAGNTQT